MLIEMKEAMRILESVLKANMEDSEGFIIPAQCVPRTEGAADEIKHYFREEKGYMVVSDARGNITCMKERELPEENMLWS